MSASRRRRPIAWLGLVLLSAGGPAAAGTIAVISPRAGDTWCAGSTHVVTWALGPSSTAATVRIAYSPDDGKTWTDLAEKAPAGEAFSWVVPDRVSDSCRLRVVVDGEAQGGKSGRFRVVPSREVKDYRWELVNGKAAFAPRDGAGALTFRGRMWLLGGWNPGDKEHFPRTCSNDVWCSSDGRNWTLVKPNTFRDRWFDPTVAWEGRHTAGYVVLRDRLWIIGGDVNQGHYQSDVWNSADGKSWTLVNRGRPVPWGPRALHYTLAFRDRIWVMGGQTMPAFSSAPEAFYRDIWTSEDGRDWARVTPVEPYWPARGMIGGAAVFQGRMWILGGGTYDTPTTPTRRYYNDVWSSPDGIAWERHVAQAPWAARQYHEVAAFDGRLWVLEGYAGANRNDVWYSDDGSNWYEVPATPWRPRHAASVFVFDGALWMVAGNNMEPDVWKLVRGPVLAAIAGQPAPADGPDVLAPGARPQLLQERGAGDGPAWHPKLGLLTSGDGDIVRRSLDGTVSVYRKGAGSNGLMFDRQGRLVICEAANRRVTRIEDDGRLTILADRHDGHRFNRPNDLTMGIP